MERTENLECQPSVSRLYPLGNGEPQKVCEQKSKMGDVRSLTGSDAHRPHPEEPFCPTAHGPGHSWGLPDSVSLESTGATSTSFLCPGTPWWQEAMYYNVGLQDFLQRPRG